jgi:GMP synthase (glutamine-hydrolysing)
VHVLDLNAGVPNQGVAALQLLLRREGFEPRVWDVRQGVVLPPDDGDAWVLSGGPGSPLDEGPWRPGLLEALAARMAGGRPTLGICYGFELMALVAGAELRRLAAPRHGTYPLELAAADPWLAELQGCEAYESRSWAPFGGRGEVLALGPEGDVAAMRFGAVVCGVIFHPEADLGPHTARVYGSVLPRYLADLP